MTKRELFISTYKKDDDFKRACLKTVVPPYIAYMWLRREGLLTTTRAVSLGTANQRKGAMAEAEFQRLMPDAMPMNAVMRANSPVYDFDIHGILVDVKYSSRTKAGQWNIRIGDLKVFHPDFFAVFMVDTFGAPLTDGYRLVLLPYEFMGERKVNLNLSNFSTVADYEVNPADLVQVFEDMASVEDEGNNERIITYDGAGKHST